MRKLRYQNRFIRPRSQLPKRWVVVKDPKEVIKWRQYYIDQRKRAGLDPELTLNQRKEILEACRAFEYTPDRTLLVKEPIDD